MHTFANIVYITLFSVNALTLTIATALTGADWSAFTRTQQFVLVCLIVGNWTNTLLALVQKISARVKQGKDIIPTDSNGNTEQFKKDEIKPITSPISH